MKYLLTLLLFVLGHFCIGQISVDLSNKSNTSQSINPQTVTSISLINALVADRTGYSVSVIIKHTPTPPLVIPTTGGGASLGGAIATGTCKTISDADSILLKETDESKISGEVKAIQSAIDALSAADKISCKPFIDIANNDIAKTTIGHVLMPYIKIGGGDELDITITRGTNVWTYSFICPQINHFTTYFGFTYVPDILTKFPNYYAKSATGGTYVITQMNGNNKNVFQNLSPTVMFTYKFINVNNQDAVFKFGVTGGFTYNTQTLGALFGPSLVIGDNITLNTGISFLQKYRLRGQYTAGQTINDNLDYSQLHEQIWTYDLFFSIGFNIPSLFTKSSSGSSSPSTSGGSNSSATKTSQ